MTATLPRLFLTALLALLVFWAEPGHAGKLRVELRDERGQALSDAVVFLESADARRRVAAAPQAELSQQQRQFVPRVLVVPVGTPVAFPNLDTVRHHVYSFSPIKKFEIKLYVGPPEKPVTFDQAGIAVMGCNIHDQMAAWVVVVETPYFAKSSSDGSASLDAVPAGSYKLRSWHPGMAVDALPASQAVTVTDTASVVQVRLPASMP